MKTSYALTPFILGRSGERFAADYLKKNKYKIIKKRFRMFRGDVDLIAYDGTVLVFVEVKTRRGDRFGLPEESVDATKQKQIRKIAREFISLNELKEVECRFDILALRYHQNKGFKVTHFKDAF